MDGVESVFRAAAIADPSIDPAVGRDLAVQCLIRMADEPAIDAAELARHLMALEPAVDPSWAIQVSRAAVSARA